MVFDPLSNADRTDPARDFPAFPPNLGRFLLPHVQTFTGLVSSMARAYVNPDEAIRDSLNNSRYMRNDLMIMQCIEQRQRATALLDWHIEVDGPKLRYHEALKERLTKILKRTPRFTEYRRWLLEAMWYGKSGAMHAFKEHINEDGTNDIIIGDWTPVNGDKIIFRQDEPRWGYRKEEEVGVRVGPGVRKGDFINDRKVVPTEAGLGTFLAPYERDLLCVHKHMIEDAAYEDPLSAGAIHGIGIRSRIYWTWYQKQELMALFMEYLERSALGFEIWYYPEGNKEAEEKTEQTARNRNGRRNIVLFPKPVGDTQMAYGVEHIEPNAAGAEALMNVLNEFFGHQIKRFILGQTLTSEAAATGLGSGVAELHLATMLDIVKYDATNLEETITRQPLAALKKFNDPAAAGVDVRFVIETESPNIDAKMAGFQAAWEMGARLKEDDVMDTIGAAIPNATDRILQNPAMAQAQMQAGAMPMGTQPVTQTPGQRPGQGNAMPVDRINQLIATGGAPSVN